MNHQDSYFGLKFNNKDQMSLTLEKMFEAGVYFGHHKSKKHPAFEKYVFATKNNISIINLEKTLEEFNKAVQYLKDSIRKGKIILFVGTKKQAKEPVEKLANELKSPYLISRWLGGGLTNFSTLKSSIEKFRQMKEGQKEGKWDKMIKKERLIAERKLAKMEVDFKGLSELSRLPDILFVVDPSQEEVAVKEAEKIKIPIVAICDSNFDPNRITIPIPANDDAIKSVNLLIESLGEELKSLKESPKSKVQITNEIQKKKIQKSKVEDKKQIKHSKK